MKPALARLIGLAGLFTIWSGPASADPIITPIIASFLVAAGVTATITVAGTTIAVATIIATVVSAVVTTAIGFALTYFFSPKPPKPENGSFPVQQTLPFRIWGYGLARVGGATCLREESSGYLAHVSVLNGHPVNGFTQLYLNSDPVTVAGSPSGGLITGAVSIGADGRYGGSLISVSTRKGLVPETVHGNVSSFGSIWTVDFRGDGCASLAILCAPIKSKFFLTNYPFGPPQPSAVLEQYKVYDPRDGAQSASNSATWVYSTNVALCILHHQCFSDFGPLRPYTAAILPVISEWIIAINACEDAMALKAGGTEARYRLGGWMTTEQDRRTALQVLLQSCDGWFVERGDGTVILRVGKYQAPTVILTDDDIAGFEIQRGTAAEEKINRATAKYTSTANDYVLVETIPFIDTVDQAARSGAPRASQLDLGWVQWTGQASRLLKREVIRNKAKTRGRLTLRMSGINACYERWITIQSNSIPRMSNIVIENRRPTIFIGEQKIEMDFVESGPSIDTYDPAVDESPPPPAKAASVSTGPPTPANVAVVVQQITDATGAVSIVLAISWDIPLFGGSPQLGLNWVIETRMTDIGGGVPGPWAQTVFTSPSSAAGRYSVITNPVASGTSLDVQVSSQATAGTQSAPSAPITVSTVIATTAPSSPTGFTATGHVGNATLVCTNPNSSNFAAVRFWRAASGGSFASATALGTAIFGAPNGTSNYTDTVAAGVYDYFVTAQNSAGVLSSPTGPASATVT